MKLLKKSIAVLLSALMITCMLPISALADEINYNVDASGSSGHCDWNYDASTSTMYIYGNHKSLTSFSYTVDGTKKYYTPLFYNSESTKIENMWRGTFDNLVIGSGIVSINSRFAEYGVKHITFEENSSLLQFDLNSFQNTPLEGDLVIPESVTTIKNYAFYGTNLHSVTIPGNIQYVGPYAFSECKSLETVVFNEPTYNEGDYYFDPAGCEHEYDPFNCILGNTFSGCTSLKNVTLPSKVTSIYTKAFQNCTSLEYFDAHNVKNIDSEGFSGCTSLKNISLSPEFYNFKSKVFYNCSSLEMDFSQFTGSLLFDDNCFEGAGLKNLVLPANVSKINNYAFKNTKTETMKVYIGDNVKFKSSSSMYGMINLVSADLSESTLTALPAYFFHGAKKLSDVTLPDCMTAINSNGFNQCDSLTDLAFLNNVTTIGPYAFSQCNGFVDVDLSDTKVTQLGTGAFRYSKKLKTFRFDDKINKVDSRIFDWCDSLESVDFCNSPVTSMGQYVFSNCASLKNVNFGTAVNATGEYCCQGDKALTEVTIPATAAVSMFSFNNCTALKTVNGTIDKKVYEKAFYSCTSLESVNFGNNCKVIGKYAFSACDKLNCKLPQKLETVEDWAFNNCKALNQTMPDTVKTVGETAFRGTGIKNVSTGLTSIGDFAFSECNNITALNFNGTNIGPYAFRDSKNLKDVSLGKNLTAIYADTFKNTNISSVTIPDTVTLIGAYAFANCPNLNSVTISQKSSLTKIYQNAFYNSNIDSIVIPSKVTNVDQYVFKGCNRLESIYVYAKECVFGAEALGTSSDINRVVYGYKGSSAQQHATANKLNFVALDDENRTLFARKGTWGTDGTWVVDYEPNTLKLVLTISGTGDMTSNIVASFNDGFVSIPEICEYYGVSQIVVEAGITSVPDNFLYRNGEAVSSVKSVVLPYTVRDIGEYAFANCINLSKVVIPGGVTEIKEGTFYNTKINTVTLPKSITSIGKKAFADCDSLIEISIGTACTDIYYSESNPLDCAFGYLGDGTLNDSLTVICAENSEAYNYAVRLGLKVVNSIGAPTEKGVIGSNATWEYFEDEKTIYIKGEGKISGKLCYIGGVAVKGDEHDVEKIVFSEGITVISGWKKANQSQKLTFDSGYSYFEEINPVEVVLPSTLERIGVYAFRNCKNLEYIKLPASLECIMNYAFAGSGIKYITMPDNVKNVYEGAFYYCDKLEGVELNHTEYVGDYALKNCSSLSYLDMGDSLEYVTVAMCANDFSLEEIVVPDSVKEIHPDAFYKCINAKKVTLGTGVEYIFDNAFGDMLYLNEFNFNCKDIIQFNEAFYNTGTFTNGFNVNFGDDVKIVPLEWSFDFAVIDTVTIGKNADCVLSGPECSSIKHFVVDPENPYLYSYKDCVYDQWDTLIQAPTAAKSVTVKPGTKGIGHKAFLDTQLTSITLPDSVTYIDDYAFWCNTELKSIIFSDNITKIGFAAFDQCKKLKTVDLPEKLRVLGGSAFINCDNLTSVIMNYDLEEIGMSAFSSCDSLKGIVIGENVKTIRSQAFSYCKALEYVYIFDSSFTNETFRGSENVTIHTMAGSNAYACARQYNVPYVAYTDEDKFYDDVGAKLDYLAGYLGYCEDGHGDIQWLTVYEATCTSDGYEIGVCEYCSEILDERHTTASGHKYNLVADIPATDSTKGVKAYTCENCNASYTEYSNPTSEAYDVESHTVSGKILVAQDINASKGVSPARGASISIGGELLATANEKGEYSLTLDTGTYEATVSYTFGFDRKVFIVVENKDITRANIYVVGCDFNRDGIINDEDMKLFNLTVSSRKDDASYLNFVDMNNDGYINASDRLYLKVFIGINSAKYQYPALVIIK